MVGGTKGNTTLMGMAALDGYFNNVAAASTNEKGSLGGVSEKPHHPHHPHHQQRGYGSHHQETHRQEPTAAAATKQLEKYSTRRTRYWETLTSGGMKTRYMSQLQTRNLAPAGRLLQTRKMLRGIHQDGQKDCDGVS